MEKHAGFKGVRQVKYPGEDMILEFGSKSRYGKIVLEEETGKFRFHPDLVVQAKFDLLTDYTPDTVTISAAEGVIDPGLDAIINTATNTEAGVMSSTLFTQLGEAYSLVGNVALLDQSNTFLETQFVDDGLGFGTEIRKGNIALTEGSEKYIIEKVPVGTHYAFTNRKESGGNTRYFFDTATLIAGDHISFSQPSPAVWQIDANVSTIGTNLSNTSTINSVTIISSTGTDTTVAAATTSQAGVLSAADKKNIDEAALTTTTNLFTEEQTFGNMSGPTVVQIKDADIKITNGSGYEGTITVVSAGSPPNVNLDFNGNIVWHAGNFDPSSKVNKTGDIMTGSLVMDGASVHLWRNSLYMRPEYQQGVNNDESGPKLGSVGGGSTHADDYFYLQYFNSGGGYESQKLRVNRDSVELQGRNDGWYIGNNKIWNTGNFDPSSKEDDLGNPSTDGYVLSSTAAGVRSWVAQGGSGSTDISITHNSSNVSVNSSTGSNGTINASSSTAAGVMTSADFIKLDSIENGAQVNTVDSVNGQTGTVNLSATDVSAEPDMGNPSTNGQLLSSQTDGTRSWVTESSIDAGRVDGYNVEVVSSLPSTPDSNTIYFVTV